MPYNLLGVEHLDLIKLTNSFIVVVVLCFSDKSAFHN